MKWTCLVAVALFALAGCGGDDDQDSSDNSGSASAPAAPAEPAAPAKVEAKPPYTKAEIIKAAGLKKEGDHYAFSKDCTVPDVAYNKAGVKALQKAADDPATVIPNKSNTVAIQIVQRTYPCAVRASLVLRTIP